MILPLWRRKLFIEWSMTLEVIKSHMFKNPILSISKYCMNANKGRIRLFFKILWKGFVILFNYKIVCHMTILTYVIMYSRIATYIQACTLENAVVIAQFIIIWCRIRVDCNFIKQSQSRKLSWSVVCKIVCYNIWQK